MLSTQTFFRGVAVAHMSALSPTASYTQPAAMLFDIMVLLAPLKPFHEGLMWVSIMYSLGFVGRWSDP
jgi:hypothetical protein